MTNVDIPATAVKRKRGAQPGNLNALKHGFYSRQFQQAEAEDLLNTLMVSLEDEIALLRVLNRRMLEYSQNPETMEQAIAALRAHGEAAVRIARLVKIHAGLSRSTTPYQATMMTALDKVMQEFKLT